LRFFSNTSTGRGQVTNAIIDLLLAQKEKITFEELMKKGTKKIEENDGDVNTIKAFSPVEALLCYIYMKMSGISK
jgi:hypothetical protein